MTLGKGSFGASVIQLSRRAGLYALWELSRRAGVRFNDFENWEIQFQDNLIVVRPDSGRFVEIRFPFNSSIQVQKKRIARKDWLAEPGGSIRDIIPDFIVPFCSSHSNGRQPLFVQQGTNVYLCTEELLASILLTLGRQEELESCEQDEHARFPASASIASANNFLRRPIVDEYGLAFEQVLSIAMPSWKPHRPPLRQKLSHDIEELGIPFSFRSAVGHFLKRNSLSSCVRDFASLASGAEPSYLLMLRQLCEISSERQLHSTMYWKAPTAGPFDTGYDLRNPKIGRVIEWAKKRGVEMGVHPSYATFGSREKLREEVSQCRAALNEPVVGGRQHYLRWSPQTWLDWESCDLAYDSSVGFAQEVGFRAGTCVPYLPWLFDLDRPAKLLEIPLLVMDGTLVMYMKLGVAESVAVISEMQARCAAVGGVFTLLWHNCSLLPPYRKFYPSIFDLLAGTPNYEWRADWESLREQENDLRQRLV